MLKNRILPRTREDGPASNKATLVSHPEMRTILNNKDLMRRLRKGHEQAKRREGRFAR